MYVLLPRDRQQLMSVADFVAAIQRRWPAARDFGGGAVDLTDVPDLAAGEIFFTGDAVVVEDASVESFYAVATWLRALLGDGHDLAYTDAGHGDVLAPFTPSTRLSDVRATLHDS